jgi:phage tail-like protein
MNREEIAQLLPAVFQRTLKDGSPLAGLLQVMETLQVPSEAVLARLDAIFDPRRTSDQFVPYLAYWADLSRLFDEGLPSKHDLALGGLTISSGLGRLRELIANASYLSQWRGTKKGLLLFLQTATGVGNFEIAENVDLLGQPRQFHISVRCPKECAQYSQLIERIVELEKPAYVTHEVSFGPGGK